MKAIEFANCEHPNEIIRQLDRFKQRSGYDYHSETNGTTITVTLPRDGAYTQFALLWPRTPTWIVPRFVY